MLWDMLLITVFSQVLLLHLVVTYNLFPKPHPWFDSMWFSADRHANTCVIMLCFTLFHLQDPSLVNDWAVMCCFWVGGCQPWRGPPH